MIKARTNNKIQMQEFYVVSKKEEDDEMKMQQ